MRAKYAKVGPAFNGFQNSVESDCSNKLAEHHCPLGSKSIHSGSDEGNSWNWELLRGPAGRAYYLKAWRVAPASPSGPEAEAVRLSPVEALQFAIRQAIAPQLLKDAKQTHRKAG
jgi:hypothetical protein